jgi:uncharacterized membrane protein
MRRPVAVKLLALCVVLIALTAVAGTVALLRETGSQRVQAEAEAAKIVSVLRITSAVLLMFGLIESVLAIGIWRGSRIAWWMSVVVNAFLAAFFVYDLIDSSSVDWEDYILAVIPTVILGIHFLAGVRQWVKQDRAVAVVSKI